MTLVFNKDNGSRLFYFKMLDSKEQIPSYLKYLSRGNYLYFYELNDNQVFGSCLSKNLESMVSWATGRVGILGPIRDIETVVYEVESLIHDFRVGENPGNYHFKDLEDFNGTPNGFPGLFQIAQDNYKDGFKGEDQSRSEIIRDLIEQLSEQCAHRHVSQRHQRQKVKTGRLILLPEDHNSSEYRQDIQEQNKYSRLFFK